MTELELMHSFRYLTIAAGFAGGFALFFYMKPVNIGDAITRVMVAILASNMLTELISDRIFGSATTDELWGVSFIIGFVSWPILGSVARFLEKCKERDIIDVIKSIKETDIGKK